jgi:hypothetical protein
MHLCKGVKSRGIGGETPKIPMDFTHEIGHA